MKVVPNLAGHGQPGQGGSQQAGGSSGSGADPAAIKNVQSDIGFGALKKQSDVRRQRE